MPTAVTYPGVYIEEIPSGVRTITGVSTSVTAFVGSARRGPINRAVRLLSFADFERAFGGLRQDAELGYAVRQFFQNGGSEAWVVRIAKNAVAASRILLDDAGANVLDTDGARRGQERQPDRGERVARDREPGEHVHAHARGARPRGSAARAVHRPFDELDGPALRRGRDRRRLRARHGRAGRRGAVRPRRPPGSERQRRAGGPAGHRARRRDADRLVPQRVPRLRQRRRPGAGADRAERRHGDVGDHAADGALQGDRAAGAGGARAPPRSRACARTPRSR